MVSGRFCKSTLWENYDRLRVDIYKYFEYFYNLKLKEIDASSRSALRQKLKHQKPRRSKRVAAESADGESWLLIWYL